MTLTLRKMILLVLLGTIFLMANVMLVANWLNEKRVPEFAEYIKNNYLTGTAVTIIVTLLILLVAPKGSSKTSIISRTCPVCDKKLLGNANYCSECGSKI